MRVTVRPSDTQHCLYQHATPETDVSRTNTHRWRSTSRLTCFSFSAGHSEMVKAKMHRCTICRQARKSATITTITIINQLHVTKLSLPLYRRINIICSLLSFHSCPSHLAYDTLFAHMHVPLLACSTQLNPLTMQLHSSYIEFLAIYASLPNDPAYSYCRTEYPCTLGDSTATQSLSPTAHMYASLLIC